MKQKNLHRIFEQSDCLYNPKDYLEGKLSVDERYYFEKHILSCSICLDEYEGLLAMDDYKELPIIISRLNKKVDNYTRPTIKPAFLPKHKVLRIAAAILLLVGSGFFINYYSNFSSKEYASEEMVSQSIETPTIEPVDTFEINMDSIAGPLTIASTNEAKQKNRLTDETIDRKVSSKISRKKTIDTNNGQSTIEISEINDDELVVADIIEQEELIELQEADETATIAAFENDKNENPDNKKALKTEELSAKTISTESYNRAKLASKEKAAKSYLEAGILAYKQNDFGKSVELLKKSVKYELEKEKATYYLGLSYEASNKTKKAFQSFDQLLTNTQSPYYNDAMWQKALLLTKTGKNKQAMDLFSKLINTDSYNKKAGHKLDSLKK